MLNKFIAYFLDNRLITLILFTLLISWGIVVAPFNFNDGESTLKRVSVDAIPNIGENQQIVFTEWPGRSPQDIEDQITYPLTSTLLGISGVKAVRSSSMFGFSSIYVIFNDDVEYYWTRNRILEKLNSLSPDLLPENIKPSLGPDATALGQIFWYTLEGRDPDGNVTGGWDLQEMRKVQDYYIKFGLSAVPGVSEVAAIGGYIQEYQIDVNPFLMNSYDISIDQVALAVKNTNRDVGAKTIEINQVEYLIRGLGYLKSISDLELAVVKLNDDVPIRIKDIATVSMGPAERRGILDKAGAEAVGGVVVSRFDSNPMEVIQQVKEKITQLAKGMPSKVLEDGRISKLTLIPFYDRSQLIEETLDTLWDALTLEILITIIIVLIMIFNLRASLMIAAVLPISILLVFILMRVFNVEANIVALSGIAIAIGTLVDLGIIFSENVIRHIQLDGNDVLAKIKTATKEVSGAIFTAVATTIISFIPVFTLEAAEGKLFRPLAFTKTFALSTALLITLFLLPTLAYFLFGLKVKKKQVTLIFNSIILIGGVILLGIIPWAGSILIVLSATYFLKVHGPLDNWLIRNLSVFVIASVSIWLLTSYWMPIGISEPFHINLLFIVLLLGFILGTLSLIIYRYDQILEWCLDHKWSFLSLPLILIFMAFTIWQGFSKISSPLLSRLDKVRVNTSENKILSSLVHAFPGIGTEFMPSLDEGSFLLMPSSMPHIGLAENKALLQQIDQRVANIPEIETIVGKLGRVNSPLDPAPISMFENIINYKSEYLLNTAGQRATFKTDNYGHFILTSGEQIGNDQAILRRITKDQLIEDPQGRIYRNWRSTIHSSDDIWNEIIDATHLPGVTSAPKLQPIETRLIMLQSGMRAPIGIKVYGPDLETINDFGVRLENIIKEGRTILPEAVFADRIIGKPYIHLNIDRAAIARYGLSMENVQRHIEIAIGGMQISTALEGRERYPIRVRYPRELRDDPNELMNIYVATPIGAQVLLGDLVNIEYQRGPQIIKSENSFLVGYVLLDKKEGFTELDVVNEVNELISQKMNSGELTIPEGVHYEFAGNFQNQLRAEKRFMIIIPLVLVIIFLILYLQFKSVTSSFMVFVGILMAFSGGFILLGLYNTDWFLNFSFFGTNMRNIFQIQPINLSVAVWVGFIALFGIATDDGVLIGTYLKQQFDKEQPKTLAAIRAVTLTAGSKRIRPAVMTTATTLIALLPVLTSSGRGSDIMIPMAIPIFGGMLVAGITYFITPVLFCWKKELDLKRENI